MQKIEEKEIWKPIKQNDNPKFIYEVSNLGRFRRISTRTGKPKINSGSLSTGYTHTRYVKVSVNKKTIMLHRLVAEVFIPNPENKPMVNHKDLDGTNNRIDNLEWVTASENMQHSADNKNLEKQLIGQEQRKTTIVHSTFVEKQEFIDLVMNGRTIKGICYIPGKANKWHGYFLCHKCGNYFTAPLDQSVNRFYENKDKAQYCTKCNSKNAIKTTFHKDQDIVSST